MSIQQCRCFLHIFENTDTPEDKNSSKNTEKNISEGSEPRSLGSEWSDSIHIGYIPREGGNGKLFKCYHPGCDFHTDDVGEYEKHGAVNHYPNPLLYPSNAECEKYGLERQGKPWENTRE